MACLPRDWQGQEAGLWSQGNTMCKTFARHTHLSKGRAMLRFSAPLTPAATALVVACLEIASDEIGEWCDSLNEWREAYPLAATCFTPALARATLEDVVAKLRLPEAYVPTDSHWLLLYECLQHQIEVRNDMPPPALVEALRPWATTQDARALSLPTNAQETAGFALDFGALVDTYFWDTDFLLDADGFTQLGPDQKASLGCSSSTFGVTQGLAPHPDELVLRRAEEYESTGESEQEEG